jgi:intein-encoded DNA endonuclease-like protein
MADNPSPRAVATERLGEPVEQWIDRHRRSTTQLSYGQIARALREEHDVEVHPETVRAWHALLSQT